MSRPVQNSSHPAGEDSAGPERVPKVRRDVLASRIAVHSAELSGGSPTSSASSSPLASSLSSAAALSTLYDGDVGPRRQSRAAASAAAAQPRMPLSSIVKAETALQRAVHLTNGGLCAAFSVDDIRRITDGDVLRFLANSAGPAADTVSAVADAAGVADDGAHEGPGTDIEAHMAALQHEIDTFITAVDNEGRNYEIRVGAGGRVGVAIDDGEDTVDGEGRNGAAPAAEEEAAPTAGGDSVTDGRGADATTATTATAAALLVVPPALVGRVSPPTGRTGRRPPPPTLPPLPQAPPPPPSTQPRPHNARTRQSHALSPAPPLTRHTKPRQTPPPALKPPAVPVRLQGALTEAESVRVEALMDTAAMGAIVSHPYALDGDAQDQLASLEAEVRRYAAVRTGDAAVDAPLAAAPCGAAALPTDATSEQGGCGVSSSSAITELGNAYMRQAREDKAAEQRMRTVNARLQALQQRAEALLLAPADDVPAAIAALRPVWAQTPAPLSMDEAEVHGLLGLAQDEEVRAVAAALPVAPTAPAAEPFTALRALAAKTCASASELLASYETAAPELRHVPDLPSDPDEDGDGAGPEAADAAEVPLTQALVQ